jgi:ribose/xylose/arabinose/galactoside ABC-type transport system permease subunit
VSVPKLLITLGVVLLLAGLLWPWLSKLGLGRLPGDIAIKRDGFGFYFPITTSIIVSVVLSLLFWILRK